MCSCGKNIWIPPAVVYTSRYTQKRSKQTISFETHGYIPSLDFRSVFLHSNCVTNAQDALVKIAGKHCVSFIAVLHDFTSVTEKLVCTCPKLFLSFTTRKINVLFPVLCIILEIMQVTFIEFVYQKKLQPMHSGCWDKELMNRNIYYNSYCGTAVGFTQCLCPLS